MKDTYLKQVKQLTARIASKLGGSNKELEAFTEHLFAKVPVDELARLADGRASDISANAHRFLQERTPNAPKFQIFKPTRAQHGYDSHRLVIQALNDDKPFLLDSLLMEVLKLGFTVHDVIHPIFYVLRDASGALKSLSHEPFDGAACESYIYIETSPLPEGLSAKELEEKLLRVLAFVTLAVDDWKAITQMVASAGEALSRGNAFSEKDFQEARDFVQWLLSKNFVFLGYASVDFEGGNHLKAIVDRASLLGISKIDAIPNEVHSSARLIDIRKANRPSPVHRNTLMDVITIKRFDAAGKTVGEHRVYGLFTSSVYYQSTDNIPYVRQKIQHVQDMAGFAPASHDGKALKAILEFLPRDEMFQIHEDDLFTLSLGVLAMELRPRVKLFVRKDTPQRYLSCLVFVPREYFSTEVRHYIQERLESAFNASHVGFKTDVGESPLARLHLTLRTSAATPESVDVAGLETEIAAHITRWADKLKAALTLAHGEERAERLMRQFANAFPAAYTNRASVDDGVHDIAMLEQLEGDVERLVDLKRLDGKTLSLKIFSKKLDLTLSDILPTLEHMGLKTIEEHPYTLTPAGGAPVNLREIITTPVQPLGGTFEDLKPAFETSLLEIWNKRLEDDRLQALVLAAGLSPKQVELLRSLRAYLKQAGFAITLHSVTQTLVNNVPMARLLVALFEARFDPAHAERDARVKALHAEIDAALKNVASRSEDHILRTLAQLVGAILRTNYFLAEKPVLSFKFDSAAVPNLPLPKPFAEIFVYSARVEGIHLRGGKVARGGIRWSDRHDDFRTEVLGLMKAQMVKNAVIVPVGSKGGFIVKQVSATNREAFAKEGLECYKLYLSGLLDITDNIVDGVVVPPANVVRHDGDDPYLVVAADKGTAHFSDTANSISKAYGFWLGDAFASGGANGYDHKKMAITARGGFVSVARHFKEMGVDISKEGFTAVGIGDMAGDVFGNGMLLAPTMKLLAAFNHQHIVIDPNPDPATSFAERKRLFDLPRSSWSDYSALSTGGGIYERSAKLITPSAQAKAALSLDKSEYTPDELIQAILKAPVDLLWNGGIGTYVKAETETHEQVGDRANNAVRVNGKELRCKVVGEGGNLGFTQKGRIEYARAGGRINTDAIDNSGGVDCSDHEVNIKIAFAKAMQTGSLTLEARNDVLKNMTDAVARLVLKDNSLQTRAISMELAGAPALLDSHARLMRTLEAKGLLNRAIEYLPDELQLAELKTQGKGLSRPELAVLLAYSKMALCREITESTLPDDSYFATDLLRYFPEAMKERYRSAIEAHPLKRDIIATVATNSMVNRAGITFYYDIVGDSGADVAEVVGAYTIVRDAFKLRTLWDTLVPEQLAYNEELRIHRETTELLDHATRRVLKLGFDRGDIAKSVARFAPVAEHLGGIKNLPALHDAIDIAVLTERARISIQDAAEKLRHAQGVLLLAPLFEKAKTTTLQGHERIAFTLQLQELADQVLALAQRPERLSEEALARYLPFAQDIATREALDASILTILLGQLRRLA